MATDNQSLVNQAACVDCAIPQGMQLSVLIVLFAQLAGVSLNPQALVNLANCVQCAIPAGMQMAVLIQLANQILAVGTSCLYCGQGAPSGPPSNSNCTCALYVDTNSGDFYYYNVNTAVWVVLIGG
jgi:hypothetical protein